MIHITLKEIGKQLYWDLVGKDSQRGISLTYAWMCNQWGHIALGFIPAMFMGAYGDMHWWGLENIVIAGLLISVIATVFEAYNYLWPLLTQRGKMSFEPDWMNVGFDTCTDLLFFYIGGLTAIQVLASMYGIGIADGYGYALMGAGAAAFVIAGYWYTVKMYVQAAGFPFQFRLSQWMFAISERDKQAVLAVVKHKERRHILVFGQESTGKTGLAVAIATEFAIRRTPALYTTACKMSDMFLATDAVLSARSRGLWTWRGAECLVIDDINTGNPVPDIVTPEFLRPLICSGPLAGANTAALKQQTVIWVIGTTDRRAAWEAFIAEIGIAPENILCIDLTT